MNKSAASVANIAAKRRNQGTLGEQKRATDEPGARLAVERDAAIVRKLEENGHASVEALARLLATSTATIRRDLDRLEQAGQLRRVHGGAALTNSVPQPPVLTAEHKALAQAVYDQ